MKKTVRVGLLVGVLASMPMAQAGLLCDLAPWLPICKAGGGTKPPVGAPEIDMSLAGGALMLLAGGILVIRGRRKKVTGAIV
jgi:LPXTG-motif cell wall-anchored protein